MVNKNISNNNNEEKSKAKIFWKNVGLVTVAFVMAVVTVIVLNLNR